MLRQLSLVFVFSLFPLTVAAQEAANGPLMPFTVSVVDLETGEPITEFEYRCDIARPWQAQREETPWSSASADDGKITLQLPQSCRFDFSARAPGYIYSAYTSQSHTVRTSDKDRQFTYTLRRGVTMSGRIIDAKTKEPIANAKISSARFLMYPFDSATHDVLVFSDADGQFTISGLAQETTRLDIAHAEYVSSSWPPRNEQSRGTWLYGDEEKPCPRDNIVVELDRGETAFGVILALDGTPIESAKITSDNCERATTGPDGAFRVSGLAKSRSDGCFSIGVKKAGYIDLEKHRQEVPEDGFRFVLKPLLNVRGRVLDADRKPVKAFTVMAGLGKMRTKNERVTTQVRDDEGRFVISFEPITTYVPKNPKDVERLCLWNWLVVKADGHAFYEDTFAYDPNGVDLTITLAPGVSISGRLTDLPPDFGGGEALLLPLSPADDASERDFYRRYNPETPSGSAAERVAATIAPDGTFRLDGVSPGPYEMTIDGKGITHQKMTMTVSDKNMTLDPIAVTASGRIEGRAFDQNGEPCVFEEGDLDHSAFDQHWFRSFMTDEDGRFTLEDVPAGSVSITIGRNMYDGSSRGRDELNVAPGETTKVVLNNPESETRHDVQFRIKIGDGSQAQRESGTAIASKRWLADVIIPHPKLSVVLDPIELTEGRKPRRCRQAFDPSNTITIGNVEDGEYRVRVFDSRDGWYNGESLLYEGRIDVKAGVAPIDIQLGAGAITGRLDTQWKPIDRFTVAAIKIDEGNQFYSGYTETSGVFCVRFLPPGEYVLYCVERANGYCRTKPIRIADNLVDIGEVELKQGATLQGKVRFARRYDFHVTLEAVNEQGFKVVDPTYFRFRDKPFRFTNLPPGTWTLRLMNEDEVIESQTVKLEGTETIEKDMVAK